MSLPPPHRNGEPHEVHCSAKLAATVRQLQREATDQGRGLEFLTALRQILRRLRRDPNRFGEPLFRLPALHLQVRKAAIWPVVIHFGVTVDESLVLIRGVFLMPQRRR